jgi:YHS domain-containing protein
MSKLLIFLFATIFLSSFAHAVEPINTYGTGGGVFSDPPRTEIAIKGYDTVAYFEAGKPTPGTDEFVMTWKGAKWKFSSAKNLELFKSNPNFYSPQYGGYCAYGVANGYTVKIEPDQWTIVGTGQDRKLYLNYDSDVSKKWNKDQAGFIKTADSKFLNLFKKN